MINNLNFKKYKSNDLGRVPLIVVIMVTIIVVGSIISIWYDRKLKQKWQKENPIFVIDGTNITFQDQLQHNYVCRVGVVYLLPQSSKGSEVIMLDINGKPLTCSVWNR